MSQSPAKITAVLTAHPGKSADLQALLVSMTPHCRAEPGNLRWDVWRDQANPERYVLDELYRDADAVEAHRRTPHYQDYLARIPSLAERSALVLEAVSVSR
ncbi:putative quinol monooxygenase [Burkholderia ubonensis]|uniref:putative quinol monooxygenase n=1 Tax=Burkholderia ubonensis TaxID=101571 RepID=UPI00358E3D17